LLQLAEPLTDSSAVNSADMVVVGTSLCPFKLVATHTGPTNASPESAPLLQATRVRTKRTIIVCIKTFLFIILSFYLILPVLRGKDRLEIILDADHNPTTFVRHFQRVFSAGKSAQGMTVRYLLFSKR
jgi:hypothetical protein